MKKPAFTLLELTIVIVVLGILAAMALPRMERDLRQEAGDNILSAIRYAQHMALMDNVTDGNENNAVQNQWQRSFWRFGVRACKVVEGDIFYEVGSDKNRDGDIDNSEAAVDPMNGHIMVGAAGTSCAEGSNNDASPEIFISHKYGIKYTNTIFTDCGAGSPYIGFDHLGRPHTGFAGSTRPDHSSLLHADCELRFEFEDGDIDDLVIIVEKGTGHAYIEGQLDS